MDNRYDEDERTYVKRKKLLEPLVISEGWKELELICKAQAEEQIAKLIQPSDENKDGLAQGQLTEYRKGAIFGIRLVLSTPHAIIAYANQIISATNVKESSNEREPEQRTSSERVSDNELDARVTDLSGE